MFSNSFIIIYGHTTLSVGANTGTYKDIILPITTSYGIISISRSSVGNNWANVYLAMYGLDTGAYRIQGYNTSSTSVSISIDYHVIGY